MDDERKQKEYLAILEVFERFLEDTLPDLSGADEIIEALSDLRAEFAINYALNGFDMDYTDALELLHNENGVLSEEDQERKKIIIAAIDNLIDFSVVEEYQMMDEIEETLDAEDEDEEDSDEKLYAIFKKYNSTYSDVENMDIEYAMMIAASLVTIKKRSILTYMTQGDERVRPWHAQYEGFSAPKSEFPEWLIPPIEHACRCYLVYGVEDSKDFDIKGEIIRVPEMPSWFNKTFKESVAFGGRIFSDEHPYFDVNPEHLDMLKNIANKIKTKYFGNE